MKGIEISENFYRASIAPMLHAKFPEYEHRIAVGLVGQGSECFGFDDAISQDHDFGKRIFLWITREDDQKIGMALKDAYRHIAIEAGEFAPDRSGVFTIEQFYKQLIGHPSHPSANNEWMCIPEYALATAVNGAVFRDDLGAFSAIRKKLSEGFPQDVALKKLAGHLALMAQSGQYNFPRSLKRQENSAAALALYEFIDHSLHVLFILNGSYTPYYKWRFRAASELPFLAGLAHDIEEFTTEPIGWHLIDRIEMIANRITTELQRRGFSSSNETFLEAQAKEVTKRIQDPALLQLHLMEFGAE
ncbi:MAG: DUF4037 domain-containing protein [Clostridia bacterium]|nr:DUF4037 domain-containing protein [Clostridia bacterium]